jgi:molybdopterin converting factor small subunit
MSVRINHPPYLQPYAGDSAVVEVSGKTAAECLTRLVEQHPDIGKMLFAVEGKLHDYVSVYVNGDFAYAEELSRPVKDGDELHILYILGGG